MEIEKRNLGRTEIKVSILGLGTWVFGGTSWGGADDRESISTIEKALEAGINFFDTAPAYGGGKAETILGNAISERDKVVIASKALGSKEDIISSLQKSLKRLKTDYVDLFYIHWPGRTSIKEQMEAMIELKKRRQIKAVGVSNYSLEQLKEACSYVQIDALQPPYSLYWRFAEEDLIPFCQKNNIAVVGYSPLARGILSGKFTRDWKFKEGDDRPTNILFKEEHFPRAIEGVEKIKKLAENKNSSIPAVAIKWCLLKSGITSVLIGARNVSQLIENLKVLSINLDENDMEYLEKISDEVLEPIKKLGYTNPFGI